MSFELSRLSEKVKAPKNWQNVSTSELKKIRGVCLDIDDTLSTSGKLEAEPYASLWKLREAGFAVVPITGRPAGWCDHIARFWPVNAVVGENGAFTFFMENGVRKRIDTPTGIQSRLMKSKMQRLTLKIQKKFSKARWASDQSYREFDLAIDICEDVQPWSSKKIEELLTLCHGEGAHAKLSSVHVNTWFGDYDKRKGFEHWLAQGAPGAEKKLSKDQWLYIGDSPNDEPMFKTFRCSVGVANLRPYLPRLSSLPTYLTRGKSGKGFVEMANKLIRASK